MYNRPKFSVIIPVYNKSPHIQRSISSVLNQTFGDLELIIINDASTDNSLEEIQKFKDSRIRLFHRDTPGPGGYAARNLGIENAKAEWLAFLDADDEWMPEHLEKMSELADKYTGCAFLSCGWNIFTPEGHTYTDIYFQHNSTKGSHEISFKEYLKLCIKHMRPIWTSVVCIYNNNIAKSLFPAGKANRGGDTYAWGIYLAHNKKMAWSPHIGATYYRNSVNMITNTMHPNTALLKKLINEISPLLDKKHLNVLLKYKNRQIWNNWRENVFFENAQFNLAANLSWKADILFYIIHMPISIIPVSILKRIRTLKRIILNRVI